MPSFDIVKKSSPLMTFRVSSICGAFDLDVSHVEEHFKGSIDLPEEWNIGLIVGSSGTGKTTIAKELFGSNMVTNFSYQSRSVVDDMPKGCSVKDIERAFVSAGFSSPPSWLKPYEVLSNGEKMRCDIARAMLSGEDLFVFDEFTSVVDREVAKTASLSVSKAVRRAGKKFVAVACHRDIMEWLQPDWVFDTDVMRFFALRGNTSAPRSTSTYTGLATKIKQGSGRFSGAITI